MLIDWGPVVLSLIAAAVSVIGIYAARRRENASVAETYEAMAARQADEIAKLRVLIRELRQDLDFKEEQIEHLDRRIEEWTAGIDLLIKQLVANGIQPAWKPKMEGKL
jgi:chromosome segregation ATPase